ncbi:MAG: hypothetical protein AAB539_00125 [Patescibacteria group bacterium]
MNIVLDKNLQKELRKTSALTGLDEQELARRAIILYLESMRGMTDFVSELRAWQQLDGESLRLLDASLSGSYALSEVTPHSSL